LRLCALLLCRFILLRGCIRFVCIRLLCRRSGWPIGIVLRLRRILLRRLLWRLGRRGPIGIVLRRRLIRLCARLISVVLLSRLRWSFCNFRLPHRGLGRIVHPRRNRVWRRCNFNRCCRLLFRRLRL